MIASEKEIVRRKPRGYVFKVRTRSQLEAALTLADYVIVSPDNYVSNDKIWLAPPRFSPSGFTLPGGVHDIYCQNVGHLMYGNSLSGVTLHGGFGLNVINNEASSLLAGFGVNDITVGIEANVKDILRIKSDILTIYAYGRFPLMLIKQRLKGSLTDRTGRHFPIKGDEILNSVKLSLSGRLEKVNADRLLLDFNDESPQEMENIYRSFRKNVNISADNRENITRGLYGI
ncbi:MAG: hypothetical protein LBL80_02490 [Ruminococcus sp.]|jgi:putative protease|nr:hypothetical protein [Ruminococcus sp.]